MMTTATITTATTMMAITAAAAAAAQYPRGGVARASYKYLVICNSPLNTYHISKRRDGFDYDVVSPSPAHNMKKHHFLTRFKSRETFLQLNLPTFEFVSSHYADELVPTTQESRSFLPI